MALLTVTLNAAVDKIYSVPGFAVDHVQRPAETRTFAGGKGINVARVTRHWAAKPLRPGFSEAAAGNKSGSVLTPRQLPHNFVPIAGKSRVCSAIVDPDNGTETVINEIGSVRH